MKVVLLHWTGTTAVVCNRMGRRYIGSELLPHYVEIAKERLSNDNVRE